MKTVSDQILKGAYRTSLRFKYLAGWLVQATGLILVVGLSADDDSEVEFSKKILPSLEKYCADCHDPGDEHSESDFLKTRSLSNLEQQRSEWKRVISQLRNRAMPPEDEELQPSESERMKIANWLEEQLRQSALRLPEFAGQVATRRLNRDAYNNTVRDLLGLDLGFDHRFPVDGSGGEGFDNNGETLFLQPLLMERYVEAAQEILNRAIISPPFLLELRNPERQTEVNGKRIALGRVQPTLFRTGNYRVDLELKNAGEREESVALRVDGIIVKRFSIRPGKAPLKIGGNLKLSRGIHVIELVALNNPQTFHLSRLKIHSQFPKPSDRDTEIHDGIFKLPEPGPSKADDADRIISRFATKAFRRPLGDGEINPFLKLYQRSIQRGDPHEEAIKLALTGVLISPHFLFLIEEPPQANVPKPIEDFELASRLSYFLWTTMPDERLFELARKGSLNQPKLLEAEIDRMIDDNRSSSFFRLFTGQWLGTRDVGGKVAPVGDQKGQGYTSDLGFSLRDEPVHMLTYLFRKDRPLTDLIDSDYVFVNSLTAKHYGLKNVSGRDFTRVSTEGNQRGGLLGMGAVHMLTSSAKRTSPVLRGVWVHETLLGTHVPFPAR